jgi:hypothetical protein
MGLMMLTAAVPLVPVLDYMSSLGKKQSFTPENTLKGIDNNMSDGRFEKGIR